MAESRKRRRASAVDTITKKIALENVEVPIRFEGDRKLYHLLWTELLTMDEVPFQNYEDIELGMRVMAPWCTTEGSISYSEAFVCDSTESEQKKTGKKTSKLLSPKKIPTNQSKPSKRKALSPSKKKAVSPKRTATEEKKPTKKAVSPSKQTKSSKKIKEKVRATAFKTSNEELLAILEVSVPETNSSRDPSTTPASSNCSTSGPSVTPASSNCSTSGPSVTPASSNCSTSGPSVTPASSNCSTSGPSVTPASSNCSTSGPSVTPASSNCSTSGPSVTPASSNCSTSGPSVTPASSNCSTSGPSVTPASSNCSTSGPSVTPASSNCTSGPSVTPASSNCSTNAPSVTPASSNCSTSGPSVTPTSSNCSTSGPSVTPTSSNCSTSGPSVTPTSSNCSTSGPSVTPASSNSSTVVHQSVLLPQAYTSEHTASANTSGDTTPFASPTFTGDAQYEDFDTYQLSQHSLSIPTYDCGGEALHGASSSLTSSLLYEDNPLGIRNWRSPSAPPLPVRNPLPNYSPSNWTIPLVRRRTYPPSASDWSGTYSDDDLASSSCASMMSQPLSPVGLSPGGLSPGQSPELQFVYNNWITPLQKQLEKVQSGFEELLKLHKLTPLSKCEHKSSPAMEQLSKYEPETSTSTATQQQSPLSKSESDSTQDVELEDSHQQGSYIGYENKPKYRVWVPNSSQEIKQIESTATDYKTLAAKLFKLVCKAELTDCPDDVCCTHSDGRNLIDQEKLRGIRLHVHRRFLSRKGVKFHTPEEEEQWGKALKAMNAHIRYRRLKTVPKKK